MKNSNALSLVLVIGIMVVVGCSCPQLNELRQGSTDNSNRTTVSGTPSSSGSGNTTDSSKSSALTMEKYNQIKNGMTYKQVVEIVGSEGTETMSSGEGKYKVTSYKWEGEDFQFITTVFMGDKLTSKVQANLK